MTRLIRIIVSEYIIYRDGDSLNYKTISGNARLFGTLYKREFVAYRKTNTVPILSMVPHFGVMNPYITTSVVSRYKYSGTYFRLVNQDGSIGAYMNLKTLYSVDR